MTGRRAAEHQGGNVSPRRASSPWQQPSFLSCSKTEPERVQAGGAQPCPSRIQEDRSGVTDPQRPADIAQEHDPML
ncbi:hypothetical protein GJAV_G00264100 [Gymnothorax javanicus]|nr:hypothetical protein GJAV_G00264100 [Gymnothorax javanicus]